MFEAMLEPRTTKQTDVVVPAPVGYLLMRLKLDPAAKPTVQTVAERIVFWPVVAFRVSPQGCEPLTFNNDPLVDNEVQFVSSPSGRIYELSSGLHWPNYEHFSLAVLARWQAVRKAAAA